MKNPCFLGRPTRPSFSLTSFSASAVRIASTSLTSGSLTLASTPLCAATRCSTPTLLHARAFWGGLLGGKPKKKNPDSLSAVYGDSVEDHRSRKTMVDRLRKTSIPKDSIFADELGGETTAAATPTTAAAGDDATKSVRGGSLLREHLVRAVDPDPSGRVRWQRRMVARYVGRNLDLAGREPREEMLARTERRLQVRSPLLPTSVKKLGHLARQVAGKTVDEALVQMRFSPKKMARAVRWNLEEARDLAVVARGMGLGRVNGEALPDGRAVKIQTKDGRWMTVQDPTRLYVEQAWVNRGKIRHVRYKMRAKSRMNRLISPTSSKSSRRPPSRPEPL